MPKPKPPYPAAFRQQMVELVRAGRGISELAREFGCNASSIHAWVKAAGAPDAAASTAQAKPLSSAERQELVELRRKLKQVQTERDILAKGEEEDKTVRWTVLPTNAWFAVKSEKTSATSTNS
jgi:transposase